MIDIHKRYLLFLLGCMPVRSYFTYYVKNSDENTLKYLSIIGIILAIGFMVIYITGMRKTGAEVFGGKIWWNNLRPVHALLFGTFGYLAYTGHKDAYIPLALDTTIGLIAFIFYHYK